MREAWLIARREYLERIRRLGLGPQKVQESPIVLLRARRRVRDDEIGWIVLEELGELGQSKLVVEGELSRGRLRVDDDDARIERTNLAGVDYDYREGQLLDVAGSGLADRGGVDPSFSAPRLAEGVHGSEV